jgi:5-methylcytosine-specific restriction protein A
LSVGKIRGSCPRCDDKTFSKLLREFQPGEADYFANFNSAEKKAVNLITIRDLKQLDSYYSTSLLRKVSDGKPLKKRTRSGGWSEVYDVEGLIDLRVMTEEQLEFDLSVGVDGSSKLSDDDLINHLADAPKKPQKVQVVSIEYRRNPHVIDAVLRRANGICEKCGNNAPFLRRKDDSPYLEVHHWVSLSRDGDDTVENAVALCPNCHREIHHGQL